MSAPETLGALIRMHGSVHPDAPAIETLEEQVSYRELDRAADRYALALLAAGIGYKDVVAVLDGNTVEWLTIAVATARIGAILAPINTWYKADEIAYQLRHSEAKILLSRGRVRTNDYAAALAECLPNLGKSIDGRVNEPEVPSLKILVAIGGDEIDGAMPVQEFLARGERVETAALLAAEAAVSGDDIVYYLYTSGSTSAPKGVILLHRETLTNSFNIGLRLGLGVKDKFYHSGPLFYALATVLTLPATWGHGGCYVIDETFSADRALELIEHSRATAFAGYGNVSRALLHHKDFGTRDISSLEKGLTGFTMADKSLVRDGLGLSQVCSMYGLTETHGPCSITSHDDPVEVFLETQGTLLPGWSARVVDPATGEDLPTGRAGELWITGRMSPGYKDAPDLTDAVFEGPWFKTGDIVVLGEDGRIRYQGRSKEMLKVGGINVSPSEIEDLISAHPQVLNVFVVGIPDAEKDEAIVAFVVTADDIDEGEMRQFVKERAASFKVPKYIFRIAESEVPLVASGKTPRNALSARAVELLGIS